MTAAPDPIITTSTAAPAAEKPPASSMKIYLRLLGYTRPFLGFFALSILGFAIAGACKAALASVLKYFIDGLAAPDAPIATGYDVMLRRGTTSGPPKRLRPRFPSL